MTTTTTMTPDTRAQRENHALRTWYRALDAVECPAIDDYLTWDHSDGGKGEGIVGDVWWSHTIRFGRIEQGRYVPRGYSLNDYDETLPFNRDGAGDIARLIREQVLGSTLDYFTDPTVIYDGGDPDDVVPYRTLVVDDGEVTVDEDGVTIFELEGDIINPLDLRFQVHAALADYMKDRLAEDIVYRVQGDDGRILVRHPPGSVLIITQDDSTAPRWVGVCQKPPVEGTQLVRVVTGTGNMPAAVFDLSWDQIKRVREAVTAAIDHLAKGGDESQQ